tara:strand:+ start:852 stop:1910 length:1059 start_codon:yes stop_codon:yes gene_type:complete
MIQEVRKGDEIDLKSIKSFLFENRLIENPENKILIKQFSNGFSNLTYLLQFEKKEFVLRLPPKGAKFGHDMKREFKVLLNLNKGFDKAPKAILFGSDLIIGRPFYIMENVDGVILTRKKAFSMNISSSEYKKIASTWLETFIELHKIDYKKIGLNDLGKPLGYVDRQVKNWGNQYLKAKTDEIKEAEKVMNWLEKNKPKKHKYSLIHNDYKYDNVVFPNNSWDKIKSILDWEMCTIGDPLMDFGTSLAYWTMESDHKNIKEVLNYPTVNHGNPSRMELVDIYESKTKIKINDLVFYYTYGLFKISVIVQQIFLRYKIGLTSNKKFKDLNKMTKLLLQISWQSIQKNRIERLF